MRIIQRPSPNHGPRKGVTGPDMILIHYTAMETCEPAVERLCDPEPEVSAHYIISEQGVITQMVSEDRRAWHAGVSEWEGETDINSCSIGIELANPGPLEGLPPFPEPQMTALTWLIGDIQTRWPIQPTRILGHSDVAPGRKTDPGPKFDWARLKSRFDRTPETP